MPLTRAIGVSALMIASAVLRAQTPLQPGPEQRGRHTVTGSVTDSVTGQPIRRALVDLAGGHPVLTDDSGHFTVENVLDGRQVARYQKPGFFSPEQIGFNPSQINVRTDMQPVHLELIPYGSISGRVLSQAGEPVENMLIQLIGQLVDSGRKLFTLNSQVVTDEDGSYQFGNLGPGVYWVRMAFHSVPPADRKISDPGKLLPREVYSTQYHPGGTTLSTAQGITIQAGGHEEADFTAVAVPGYLLRGTVSSLSQGTFISLMDPEGIQTINQVPVDPGTGQWTFGPVAQGTWTVSAKDYPSGSQGETTVTVSGRDLSGIPVVMTGLASLPVQIRNPPDQMSSLQARLLRDDVISLGNIYLSPSEDSRSNGHLTMRFDGVPAGHYRFLLQSNGPACVEAVTSEGEEVARSGISIGPGGNHPPVVVTMRQDCATMLVKIRGLPPDRRLCRESYREHLRQIRCGWSTIG
jgi:hypothetical protein